MHDSGRITLGSHTYDMHENGTRQGCAKTDWETEEEYHETLYADLSLMQTRFQEELQIQPAVFAYPYGFVCSESKPVLADLGFQITLTCLEKPNFITRNPACLYGINRYNRPGNTSTAEIMQKVLSDEKTGGLASCADVITSAAGRWFAFSPLC